MRFLRDIPLRRKLTVTNVLSSGVALLLACGAFVTHEVLTFKDVMVADLSSVAGIIAHNSSAALIFGDPDSAERTLESFSTRSDVIGAALYDGDGRLFARFEREAGAGFDPPHAVGSGGYRFGGDRLELVHEFEVAGEPAGTVYIEANVEQLGSRMARYGLIALLVMLVSSGVALLLSSRLQRGISAPVSDLAAAMNVVRTENNYSVRATKQGDDELGSLIEGFNARRSRAAAAELEPLRAAGTAARVHQSALRLEHAVPAAATPERPALPTLSRPVPVERRFQLPGLTLAAQVWGEPKQRPVLALHGWLDNAGSFELLAPRLPECEVVALDLAGHGFSDSRSADSSYNIWQDVGDLLDVADALDWPRCTLLGHSRGAAISMLFAATFPERVDKLVLLEGGLPLTAEAEEAPQGLAEALRETRALRGKTGRVFSQRATAIAERAAGFSKVSPAAAEVLARRSLREVPGGYRWHADQRLKAQSELRLTAEHVRAFARRVTAPVLLLFAADSPFADRPLYREMPNLFASIEVERLPGGHHFHLEGAEQLIADRVGRFLARA